MSLTASALLSRYTRAQDTSLPSPTIEVATIDGGVRTLTRDVLNDLRGALHGALLLPQDSDYDAARRVVSARFDKHPAFVVQVSGAADVALAVAFARENGLLLAVKGGGHNEFGVSTCESGMMLDLSPLRGVRIDANARRAWVAGSTLAGLIDHEAGARGLAVPLGGTSTVGIGGLALGGGIGKLSRRFGLTLDAVRAVDIVSADAQIRRTSERENPDLFWAVRGGGGNLGVATAFELELYPIPNQVFAGSISFPFEQAQQVLAAYGDYSSAAPNSLYVELFLAARANAETNQLRLNVCFSGTRTEADRALQTLRRFGDVLRDDVKVVTYPVAQSADAHASARTIAAGPATNLYGRSGFLAGLDTRLAATIAESLASYPERHINMLFLQTGGAISQRSVNATAFAHRNASHDMLFAASWNTERQLEFARQTWALLHPFTRGFYVNDMAGAVSPSEVFVNYGPNAARLAAAKARWDPQNLFRLNANILPGGRDDFSNDCLRTGCAVGMFGGGCPSPHGHRGERVSRAPASRDDCCSRWHYSAALGVGTEKLE
jgi:FAD/FMN-containing dehydrogenase